VSDQGKLNEALKKAYHYLKYRERSKYEIKKKLEEEGFNRGIVKDAIEKLLEKNIVNDKRFTQMYVEDSIRIKKRGPHRIRKELKELGIEEYIITDTLKDFREDFLETLGTIIKDYISSKALDESELLKLKRKLYRKGFSTEDIESELEKQGLE